jgi:hypothetical protein
VVSDALLGFNEAHNFRQCAQFANSGRGRQAREFYIALKNRVFSAAAAMEAELKFIFRPPIFAKLCG